MYLLIDIGASKTRIALSEDGKTIEEPRIIETIKDFEEELLAIQRNTQDLLHGRTANVGIVGVAGVFNKEHSILDYAPHLPEWAGKPIKARLEEALSIKVYIENDTALVGLGEAVSGAGKGYSIVAYLTISTGVGGVRIVNKKLDEYARGFEPGHQIIHCDGPKELEYFISGAVLEERHGCIPSDIKDPHVWDEVVTFTGYGIYNTLVYWSPDIVIVGGGLIVHDLIDLEVVRKKVREITKVYRDIPPIVKALHGDLGGLYGGLASIKEVE
jgi:predicted NBD/HSP70 family sugar kinase